MSKIVSISFGGTLVDGRPPQVRGFEWEYAVEGGDWWAQVQKLGGTLSGGRIGGCVTLMGGVAVVDLYGMPETMRRWDSYLIEMFKKLLEAAIRELLDTVATPDPETDPTDGLDRSVWAEREEYGRVRREVEREAAEATPPNVPPGAVTPLNVGEPVAWAQVYNRDDYDPQKDAFVSVNDSRTIMGFRTANGVSTGKGVRVAVLDTGCKRYHPAIPVTVRPVIDCTGRGGAEADLNGHGTFCVSQIVGIGPAEDPIGTAPDVEIVPIAVLDSVQGWGADSWIARGIDTAVRLGCHIASLSLGGDSPMPLTEAAIKRAYDKNIIIVAAAGNGGAGVGLLAYPARYTECFSVGACDDDKIAAQFSQGQTVCDVYACGVRQIGAAGPSGYGAWSGTSMATPHIAAAVALYQSFHREVHGDFAGIGEVAEVIGSTVVPVRRTGGDELFQAGLIQADAAMLSIRVPPPVDPPPPADPQPITIVYDHTVAGVLYAVSQVSQILSTKTRQTVILDPKVPTAPTRPTEHDHPANESPEQKWSTMMLKPSKN